jgi:hypothetical protein
MDRSTALRALALALLAGVTADVLFRGNALGVNVVLQVAVILVAGGLVTGLAAVRRTDPWDRWLPVAALVFAAFAAIRADPALILVDMLLALASTSAWLAALGGARVSRGAFKAVALIAAVLCASAVAGAATVIAAARPITAWLPRRRSMPRAVVPVIRGLVIATPLLLIFAGLFSAADAVFATGLERLLTFDLDIDAFEALDRTVVVLGVAWVVAGLFVVAAGEWSSLVDARDDPRGAEATPSPRSLGAAAATPATPAAPARMRLGEVEASVVLLAIDALFAVFVALQVAYLFGGRDTLAATGVTYADYARRGFFELLTVAALAGATVAGLEALVARRSRVYLVAALGLILFTLVIVASSFLRLRLYQDAYGWTELRFWVLLSIGWVACSLVALAVLVARDRSAWVVHALGALGIVTVALANLVGPQAFVADQNLRRALDPSLVPAGGRTGLDEEYLGRLGDDAIPALVAVFDRLPEEDRAWLGPLLAERRRELSLDPRYAGWPAANWSRARALDALVRSGW